MVGLLLGKLRVEVLGAIREIRRLVNELYPAKLEALGLVEALREQASHLGQPHGSEASRAGSPTILVEVHGEFPPLPAAVELAAYRIVTEALTNAARHAQARTCTVRLSVGVDDASNRMLDLEVSDDGRGLTDHRGGIGLTCMRERATELGGTFTIRSIPRAGTHVHARLPL
jgi:two-component system NarL family sensor kinase